MFVRMFTASISVTTLLVMAQSFAAAVCPVDEVVVSGRVENGSPNAEVRVELIYPRNAPGEAGTITVENGKFRLPLDFLTQSRGPIINRSFEKCNRKPETVVVKLLDATETREYARISLDFSKDFKLTYARVYSVKSEVVLHAP